MRKLIFLVVVVVGALAGLFSAAMDDWATRIVMMGVGALFGAPIGAALAGIGRKRTAPTRWDKAPQVGIGTSVKDLAANYWRDEGHPPFTKPLGAEPDAHMFDPNKLT